RNITVADIIFAVDEPLDATNCGGKGNCKVGRRPGAATCMTHDLWTTLNRKMIDYLDSVSLQDLVDQQRMRQLEEATMAQRAARRARDAMLPWRTEKFGNPASTSHSSGWEAEEAVDAAREQVALLVGAEAREIVFTAGATESNNLALKGAAHQLAQRGRHIVT